jgi:hypothetical protein
MTMTSQERFNAVMRGQIPDRVPILVFSMTPDRVLYNIPAVMLQLPEGLNQVLPQCKNIKMVLARAGEVADFLLSANHPNEAVFTGAKLCIKSERYEIDHPGYYEWRNTLETPLGPLTCSNFLSDKQLPPYEKEPLFKEPNDIRKFLSLPYEPYKIDHSWVQQQTALYDHRYAFIWNVGAAPASLLHNYAGPENFSLWTLEHKDLLLEAVSEMSSRRLKLIDALAAAGAGPIYQSNGHEEFLPPLQSPQKLREFIFPFEKQFCRRVHEHGGIVYTHSHGRVSKFLEEFMDLGMDGLQALEPPPMGDVDLADAKRRIGHRVTLIGNIQTHDLMTMPTKQFAELVRHCVRTGKVNGRFALSLSAEPIITPTITDLHRDNLLTYFDVAYEEGKY